MSRFQLGKKPGRKPLRLLILAGALALILSGCGASKYESVDLSMPGVGVETVVDANNPAQNEAVKSTENPAIVLGETTAEETLADNPVDADGQETDQEEKNLVYQDTDDYVIVTADVLNVREADNTESRIFVQLPTGEILHRTAYNDEWCRVDYDGGAAFVSADMVEITEPPIVEAAESSVVETAEDFVPEYQKTGNMQEEAIMVPPNGHIVAIDAGRQAKANAEKEPIGPASQTKKAKMAEGAVGAATGVKEFELTLKVAKQLQEELKARGYEVVMIRESHDVNLSNAERSVIANESDAEILIRLYANSMDNSSIYGAMAICMTEHNPYNSELSSDSYRLSKQIVNNICANTGTKNRGVQKVDNSSAINWCTIPVSVVEMGFLTNPDEDRWLQTEEYQKKIVSGISDAVDTYFAAGDEE